MDSSPLLGLKPKRSKKAANRLAEFSSMVWAHRLCSCFGYHILYTKTEKEAPQATFLVPQLTSFLTVLLQEICDKKTQLIDL